MLKERLTLRKNLNHLSDEEILKEKTGLIDSKEERSNPMRFRTGLLVKPEHERVNTPEEKAFLDEIYAKYDRGSIPNSWDSRAKGNDAFGIFEK